MRSKPTISLRIAPGRFGGCQGTDGWRPTRFNHPLKGNKTILEGYWGL
jgi:hypothetical protein